MLEQKVNQVVELAGYGNRGLVYTVLIPSCSLDVIIIKSVMLNLLHGVFVYLMMKSCATVDLVIM